MNIFKTFWTRFHRSKALKEGTEIVKKLAEGFRRTHITGKSDKEIEDLYHRNAQGVIEVEKNNYNLLRDVYSTEINKRLNKRSFNLVLGSLVITILALIIAISSFCGLRIQVSQSKEMIKRQKEAEESTKQQLISLISIEADIKEQNNILRNILSITTIKKRTK